MVAATAVGDFNLEQAAFEVFEYFLAVRELILVQVLLVTDGQVTFWCFLSHLLENGEDVKHSADFIVELLILMLLEIVVKICHVLDPDVFENVVEDVGEEPRIELGIDRNKCLRSISLEVAENDCNTFRVQLLQILVVGLVEVLIEGILLVLHLAQVLKEGGAHQHDLVVGNRNLCNLEDKIEDKDGNLQNLLAHNAEHLA